MKEESVNLASEQASVVFDPQAIARIESDAKTVIIGYNRRSVEAIAGEAGISRVLAEVLPEGKVKEVRNLQSMGRTMS